MKYETLLTANSILIFIVLIPLALINKVNGWIPDLFIFIALILCYHFMYNTLRLTPIIFTLLVLGHLTHAMGIFGWYNTSPISIQWDHITHFFGALPFSLLFFRFIEQWMDTRFFTKKNITLILAVFLCATGVGALVEMSEFIGYLTLGFGEGAFMFGPGDGVSGLTGSDLVDALGGGWINTGWDLIYNTLGIITGITIMIIIRLLHKKPKKAYYYEPLTNHTRRV